MKQLKAHFYLFTVNVLYGAGFTISKVLMPQYVKPFGAILIRVASVSLLFSLLHGLLSSEKPALRDLPLFFACALFGVVINQELFFLGLSMTNPINASLIMIMTPMLVYILSFLMKKEKAAPLRLMGILLGLCGAAIIIAGKGLSFSAATTQGDVLIFLNATSYAIYLVMVRPLMQKYQPLTVIRWVFLCGLLPVVFLGYGEFLQINWHSFGPEAWGSLAFVVIGVTFLAYLLNILALQQLGSTVVGAYIYIQPLVASFIAVLWGKDQLSPVKLLAALLIFTGLYLVSFTGKSLSHSKNTQA